MTQEQSEAMTKFQADFESAVEKLFNDHGVRVYGVRRGEMDNLMIGFEFNTEAAA